MTRTLPAEPAPVDHGDRTARTMGPRRKLLACSALLLMLPVLLASLLVAFEPRLAVPVAGATRADWNPGSFWHEPWGQSVVHRGIDIFADHGAPVTAPTDLLVTANGENPVSGLYVVALDRALRLHFFAHLSAIETRENVFLAAGGRIGAVGDTGNARGKPAHLHYGVMSLVPRPSLIKGGTLGHLRAIYLDPGSLFE